MISLNLPKHVTLHQFGDRKVLAEALATEIAHQLGRAIQIRGSASMAVSGGNTPLAMFKLLAQSELDWTQVTVTLVDERWVSPDNERSNERLVKQNLLVGRAAFAKFVPLYMPDKTPEAASGFVSQEIVKIALPFDVVVLGMGVDGHTASYFPDAENFTEIISPTAEMPVMQVNSKSAGESRLTLSMPMLATSRFMALHIEGEDKQQTVANALNGDELPIRHILDRADIWTNIFWAP